MISELQNVINKLDEKFNSGCEIQRFEAINNIKNAIWILQCKEVEMMNSPIFLQDQARAISARIEREEAKANDLH